MPGDKGLRFFELKSPILCVISSLLGPYDLGPFLGKGLLPQETSVSWLAGVHHLHVAKTSAAFISVFLSRT